MCEKSIAAYLIDPLLIGHADVLLFVGVERRQQHVPLLQQHEPERLKNSLKIDPDVETALG